MVLGGCGIVCMAMGGFGRLWMVWEAVRCFWEVVGWLWVAVG